MDTLTPRERSAAMAKIRAKDTKPELLVRRLIHSMGFRYRLHARKLPGHPDLVFPGRRMAIFVHGCFWHLHGRCKRARIPKSNRKFWTEKLNGNRARDAASLKQLRRLGWKSLVLWECQLGKEAVLRRRILRFLGGAGGKES
jgi:DNA mismatch endonuclease (patch repair protein)